MITIDEAAKKWSCSKEDSMENQALAILAYWFRLLLHICKKIRHPAQLWQM